MIYENGFPRPNGASDFEDSSMVAGLITLLNPSMMFNLFQYIKADGKYQRCMNSKYSFSRDQAICLFAGFYAKGLYLMVDASRIDGFDILPPSVHGHIRRCKGLKAYFFQDWWLWVELWFSAKYRPLDELNQLFAMLLVNPDKTMLKWYCNANPKWSEAISNYWNGWRDEKEFGDSMIAKLKTLIQEG